MKLRPVIVDTKWRDYPVCIWLQAPDNTKCLVYAGNSDLDGNSEYFFEDGAVLGIDSGYTNNLKYPISGNYQPREAFLKFLTRNSQWGNWKIIVQSLSGCETGLGGASPDFDMLIDYNLELYFLPKGKSNEFNFTQIPPTLNFNQSSNKLELLVHETQFYSNNSIMFSSKLNNILGFETTFISDQTLDDYGLYKLNFPQLILSSTITPASFITISQAISTVYKLNNIQSIQIRSSTIPVSGEYSSISGSQIIMSVDIPAEDIKTRYEYAASINRWYELIGGDLALTDINFQVWVTYLNGEEAMVSLSPHSKFSMLCLFCPNNITSNL